MVKNKAIFLDRDGTINVDYGYVHENDKLTFLDGAIEGLKLLSQNGYKLIIVTNQSGIGRGYFSNEIYNDFNKFLLNKLEQNGVHIDKVYTCPHIDEDNCDCRKPKIGLFKQAIKDFNIDLDNSYAIGDKERDLCICNNTKVKGILISNKKVENIVCCENLLMAATYIVNRV